MTQANSLGTSTKVLKAYGDVLEQNVDHINRRVVRVTIHTDAARAVWLMAAAIADGQSHRLTQLLGRANTAPRIDLINAEAEARIRHLLAITDRLGLELVACELKDLHAADAAPSDHEVAA